MSTITLKLLVLALLKDVYVHDQNESIKTAKHLCKTHPQVVVKYIKNFGIRDQTDN